MSLHEFVGWSYLLQALRLVLFGLALGLTLVSFQAYRRLRTQQLEAAFIGFAFISMGVGLSALITGNTEYFVVYRVVETIPFIVGFSMLYLSLYR